MWTAPKRSSWRFVQTKWMVYTQDALWSNISLNLSFRPNCCCFFSSRCKTLSKYFLLFSKPFYTTSGCKLCVSFCKKNLTLPTCLLSFVCDSILSREKVHNILIFAKFLSYSVGDMVGGGGGYFLGISTLKQTLTLVILPCEILSKSDVIYRKKNVANSENWAVSMHLPIKLFAFCIKDVRNMFCGLWTKPFTTFINNVLLSEKPGKKSPWRKSLSIAFVIILSFK